MSESIIDEKAKERFYKLNEFKIDAEVMERFQKRVGISIRLNGLQHLGIWDAAWKEKRPMSALVRDAISEYLRIVHHFDIKPDLTNKAEEYFL